MEAYASQQKEMRRQEEWIRWKLNLRRGRHVTAARSRQKMLDKQETLDRPADELAGGAARFRAPEPRAERYL
ncbi:MAG: hypothetical protein M5U09_18350 [Gammaproteobacteria bacterium]|nr:hypothetical protein [Gammaproteobacteria bacterium]